MFRYAWETDLRSWRFTYVGPQAERLLGYPLERWYEADFWPRHVHPDDRERTVAFCQQATERGENHEFEYRLLAADGREVWVRDLVSVIAGPDGSKRLCGVMVETTEQHRAADRNRQLEDRASHAQKLESLGLLAGGVAHDFNNLLVGILGNANLALEDLAEDAPARAFVQDVELAAQRAAHLTGQLLAYAGRGEVELGIHDLSQLVREISGLLKTAIPESASLELELDPEPLWIAGDGGQVGQVMMNLLTNAAEAVSEEGSSHVRLRTGHMQLDPGYLEGCVVHDSELAGECHFVEISDTGEGMDAATLERIFDPFFTTKHQGRGLGLATALGIVRRHRGAIHARSRPGEGTTIRVLFPAAEPVELRVGEPPGAGVDWRGEGTVLVADDEEAVVRVATATLERAGFQVLVARDGEQALDAFRGCDGEIRAVLLDLAMPRANGLEVLRELRQLRPDLPILLTSGYAQEDFLRDGNHGHERFLAKPFRPRELLARMQTLLDVGPGAPRA